MNKRPTPETDTETMQDEYDHVDSDIGPFSPSDTVPSEFARKLERERDEAREERDKLKQLLAADSENVDAYLGVCTERDDLLIELEEYRSIAENIGATKAVSEKEKAIRERDEALQELNDIRVNLGEDAEGYTTLHAVCALQNERDDLYYKLKNTKQSLEVALEDLSLTRKELQQWMESIKNTES